MIKVNVYIDGFNFYYGLKNKGWKKYYWLDIVSFFECFMNEGQVLNEVFYCTAIPINNQGKKDRQDLFFSANLLNPKFKLVLGKYVNKKINYKGKILKTFEEKQTDVNIAVEMIRNVIQGNCDTSILVSADSDLVPPIKLIKQLYQKHKIYTHFPPDRHSVDLKNNSDSIIKLGHFEKRFKQSLLPNIVTLKNGHKIKKPRSWK
ncbi:NYN domain-containing protein [Ekhidna sp.]|uniref:NYN domain-containing protein n=1 Tax=Ekhidna sp. TaxID=2608089 RepID=UPI0035115B84